jgi:hypothetical protein
MEHQKLLIRLRCISHVLIFPQLKHLHLHGVIMSEAAIHCLIVSCTVLEGLEINAICGLTGVHIISPTIKTFVVSGWWLPFRSSWVLQDLVIQYASWLERLIILHSASVETIRLVEALKLRILCDMIHNNTQLLIGAIIIQVNPTFRSHIKNWSHIFLTLLMHVPLSSRDCSPPAWQRLSAQSRSWL